MAAIMSPAASPPQSVTPITGGGGPAPSGSTPNAKRPMDRTSIDVALSGTRTISAEDLSAGFLNLQRLQARDETFQSLVAGAVQYTADLLNLIVTRVNTLEAAVTLASTNTMEGFQKVHDFTTERDISVRSELDTAISALKVDFERLEAKAQAAQPGVDFRRMGKAFDDLQSQLTAVSTRLSESFEHFQSQQATAATRVEILEGTSNLVHTEATANFTALSATVAELQALYVGAGAASAPTQAPPVAVDPMARGNDSWSSYLGKGGHAPVQAPAFPSAAFGGRPQAVPIHTPLTLDAPRVNGRWAVYDEKFCFR